MYLILSSLRQFWIAENTARAGKFKEGTKPANDPEDKVLGIVGMGGIGRVSFSTRGSGTGAYLLRSTGTSKARDGL